MSSIPPTYYEGEQLFGDTQSWGRLNAQDMNPYASGPGDWATVAMNGIQSIVGFKIAEKITQAQERAGMPPPSYYASGLNQGSSIGLIVLLGVAFLLLKD